MRWTGGNLGVPDGPGPVTEDLMKMSLTRAAAMTIAAAMAVLLLADSTALGSGITNSSEDLRTGWYPNESAITPGLVSGGTFGQEWKANVEGQVYAQPLLDQGTLLVATEKNLVYGLNPATGATQWSKALGATPWNPEEIHCGDLTPEIGVTSTPVIDPATGVAYMTHKGYAHGSSTIVKYWMDAIEVATGNEKPGFPVELGGTAQNASNQTFTAQTELQRPGLLLLEGVVYAGFGSDCDATPFQGWIFGVSESGASRRAGPRKRLTTAAASGSRAPAWHLMAPARSCSAPETAKRRFPPRPVTDRPARSARPS